MCSGSLTGFTFRHFVTRITPFVACGVCVGSLQRPGSQHTGIRGRHNPKDSYQSRKDERRAGRAREREISEMRYLYSFCKCDCDSRARLYTKRRTASRRAAAWLESTTYVRPTPRHLLRRPRPPIHGRAFCAPGISSLYSKAFAGRAVMACAALGRARWRPVAAGLRQSGVLPPPCKGRASPP